jgi:hypothetical protein
LPPIRDKDHPEDAPKRPIVYGKTEREPVEKLAAARAKYSRWKDGQPLLLGDFLDKWIEGKRMALRPKAYQRYKEHLVHVGQRLRQMPMEEITGADINRLLQSPLADKRGHAS